MKLRVAAAQIPVTNDIASNLAFLLRAVGFAASENADVLLTPEGSLSGYTHDFDPAAVRAALRRVTAAARKARVGLALGTGFAERAGKRYNELRFYAPDGKLLGFHAKILLCGALAGEPQGEIAQFASRRLRTFDLNGVRVGGLICNDMWANPMCTPMPDPHLSQELARMGARVIFHAVNGSRDAGELSRLCWHYHESNLRMRAMAGRVWVVTVDSCFPPDLRCSAPSGVIAPDGNWACVAEPQGLQFFAHTIELEERV